MHVVATLARAAMSRAGYQPFSGPVEVSYRATFAGPKKKPDAIGWRTAKPDLDNCVKGCMAVQLCDHTTKREESVE